MRELGGDGAGGSAEYKPLCGPHDALKYGATARDAKRGVSFPSERLDLRFFVLQVSLRGSQLCLTRPAGQGVVVEGFQILGWEGDLRLGRECGVSCRGSSWASRVRRGGFVLKRQRLWQRQDVGQRLNNLLGVLYGSLLLRNPGQLLLEFRLAAFLAGIRGLQLLLSACQLCLQVGLLAADVLPGYEYTYGEEDQHREHCKLQPRFHNSHNVRTSDSALLSDY